MLIKCFILLMNENRRKTVQRGEKSPIDLKLRVRQRTGRTVDFSELHSVAAGSPSCRTAQTRGSSGSNSSLPKFFHILSPLPAPGSEQDEKVLKGIKTELTRALPFKGFIVYPLVSGDDGRAVVFKSHPLGRGKEKGSDTFNSQPLGWGKVKVNNSSKS